MSGTRTKICAAIYTTVTRFHNHCSHTSRQVAFSPAVFSLPHGVANSYGHPYAVPRRAAMRATLSPRKDKAMILLSQVDHDTANLFDNNTWANTSRRHMRGGGCCDPHNAHHLLQAFLFYFYTLILSAEC